MLHTVSISIGRNVGSTPLPDADWNTFRDAIRAELAITYGEGNSNAGSWDGTAEETHIVLGQVTDLEATRARLAKIATLYKQDAIGLIAVAGDDTLVMPA